MNVRLDRGSLVRADALSTHPDTPSPRTRKPLRPILEFARRQALLNAASYRVVRGNPKDGDLGLMCRRMRQLNLALARSYR